MGVGSTPNRVAGALTVLLFLGAMVPGAAPVAAQDPTPICNEEVCEELCHEYEVCNDDPGSPGCEEQLSWLETASNSAQRNLPYYPGTITFCEAKAATEAMADEIVSCPLCGAEEELDVGHRAEEQMRLATGTCHDDTTLILAVEGNGGSWFQLWQGPPGVETDLYVSWALQTNNIANGADDWAFGIQVTSDPMDQGLTWTELPETYWERFETTQGGDPCKLIGSIPTDVDDHYYYYVDAGATGWMSSSQCSSTLSWEVHVGVKASITGPETNIDTTLGGSVTCGDGVVWDSESLMRGGSWIPFLHAG